MRYAIPVYGGKLSLHFGQSTEFMLVDTDQNGNISTAETITTHQHNCGSLPQLLGNQGVQVVLAGGMGMSPRLAFERSGIEVVLGVSEPDPRSAVLAHVNRTLKSGQNVCEHGDTPCDHTGHRHPPGFH